jgi:hypothetical protein
MSHDRMHDLTVQMRHEAAMRDPNPIEWPLVQLLRTLGSITVDHGRGLHRDGVAQILTGIRILLAANWGPRLDRRLIDDMLLVCAEAMFFDLEHQEFRS